MPPDPLQGSGLDKSANKSSKNADTKKGKGGIIAIVVVLLLIVAVVAVIALNIGGARDSVTGYLRNAPLIGSLFPEKDEEEEDPLMSMSDDELRARIVTLERQVESLEGQRAELNSQLADNAERIAFLSLFETRWNEYRDISGRFTQMLAHNRPIDFINIFQSIVDHDLLSQGVIDRIYEQAVEVNISNEEFRALVSTYNNMEEKNAAESLASLRTSNPPLSVRLLRAMSASRVAAIFDQMDNEVRVQFTIMLANDPPAFPPLVAPQELPEITPQTETPPPTPLPIDGEEEENIEDDEETPQEDEETPQEDVETE